MQKRLSRQRACGKAQLFGHTLFFVQAQAKFKQLRLGGTEQARQRNRRPHVRQCIVRCLMQQAIGPGQIFELETGARCGWVVGVALVMLARPDNTLRTQRVSHAHYVLNVPAATAVLPFSSVGVDQVAPEQMAGDFIVKPDAVIADANRAWLGQQAFNFCCKFMFWYAARQTYLGRDAG